MSYAMPPLPVQIKLTPHVHNVYAHRLAENLLRKYNAYFEAVELGNCRVYYAFASPPAAAAIEREWDRTDEGSLMQVPNQPELEARRTMAESCGLWVKDLDESVPGGGIAISGPDASMAMLLSAYAGQAPTEDTPRSLGWGAGRGEA